MAIERTKKGSHLPRGITKRVLPSGEITYRVRVSWEYQQYEIGRFYTLGDAKAALAIARSEIATRTFEPPLERRARIMAKRAAEQAESVTVNDWSVKWLAQLEELGRAAGTITSYRSTLKVHILPAIGNRTIASVTRDDIDELLITARAKGAPWQNVARTVRALFRAAVDRQIGDIKVSPVRIEVPKGNAGNELNDDVVATPEQVAQMSALMPADLALSVLLGAWCSLRVSEVLGLQRQDFDLRSIENARISIRRQWASKLSPPGYTEPKRGSNRTISIPPSVAAAVATHLATHAPAGNDSPVFPSPRDKSRPISHNAFSRAWTQARDQVKPGMDFHDLRHTGLTAYAAQGATLKELQVRGGHRDVKAAMIYQHFIADRDRALAATLNTGLDVAAKSSVRQTDATEGNEK